MMVPGHQFPVYLTLTKSCIYARNHTLRTPPHIWKKQPAKKKRVYQKLHKSLEINTPSKGICKGKNHQQKQKFTKATKTLQINTFLKGIWKGKSNYSVTFNHRCINSMMVRRHQFPVYLTLIKSCIYARNHTLRTPPILGKSNQEKRVYEKLQKGLKSILLLRQFEKEKTTSKKEIPKLQKRFKSILSQKEFGKEKASTV